jgi:hypothetical protein
LPRKRRLAQQGWQGIQSAAQFAGNEMVEVFDKMIQGSATFADSMKMVAAAIEKALLQAALLGSGPLAGLFGTANSAGGTGGLIGALISGLKPGPAAADGGLIQGPGTGRSDSILARVSTGEFVVNAASTAAHRPALEAINAGVMPKFADGGLVGPAMARAAQSSAPAGGSNNVQVVVNNNAPGTQADARKTSQGGVDVHEITIRASTTLCPRAASMRLCGLASDSNRSRGRAKRKKPWLSSWPGLYTKKMER